MPRCKSPHDPGHAAGRSSAGNDPRTTFDPRGRLAGVRKARAKPILNIELDQHLATDAGGGSQNGYGRKAVIADTGTLAPLPRLR